MTNREIGRWGEDTALEYLKNKGYVLLDRNFSRKWGEIDIIMLDGSTTVFVEVKTRKSAAFGYASEYVDCRKTERIRKTCISYLHTDDADMRFDVVEVYYKSIGEAPHVTQINHIDNAF